MHAETSLQCRRSSEAVQIVETEPEHETLQNQIVGIQPSNDSERSDDANAETSDIDSIETDLSNFGEKIYRRIPTRTPKVE